MQSYPPLTMDMCHWIALEHAYKFFHPRVGQTSKILLFVIGLSYVNTKFPRKSYLSDNPWPLETLNRFRFRIQDISKCQSSIGALQHSPPARHYTSEYGLSHGTLCNVV